jgi:PIN domain nuclease of toxin-antitoxin system
VLLIDTCTFVWLVSEPNRLSARAKAALDDANDIFLSDISVWEICLKWQSRKLELPSPPRHWVSEQMRVWSLTRLSLELEHLFRSVELPDLHRDPFDRLLVSQALTHDAKLVTPDAAIHQYPVAYLW